MKRFCAILFSLILPWAAHCAEEDQLLGVLQSDHSLPEKDEACVRLKWIGTARSVPILAELLTDPELSQSARCALESMPGPEAGSALRQALAKMSGSNAVGIVNSLGVRRETAAVPDLAKLLTSPNVELAVAAAEALGKTGGTQALQTLQGAWNKSGAGAVHDAQSDGLLACGNQLLTNGELGAASKIFQALHDHEKSGSVRLAAFRGLILTSEKRGLTLMVKAIAGPDGPEQGAALQLASKVGGPATTKALANLLTKEPVPMQIALLQALDQRGDRSAAPFVAEMLENTNLDVRMAALAALGDLGDGKVALRLAQRAAAATGAEKAAARQALVDLRRGPVTESLLKPLAGVPPDVQTELIRALGDRGDTSAAPKMLELARSDNDSLRSAALQGLVLLAGPEQIPDMVELVVKATNNDARSEAADALNSACQHIESRKERIDAATLAQAVQTGPLEARLALLGVCSGVSDPRVRDVLRAAASEADPRLRTAALRALCESQDEELLPDILKTACGAKEENFRMLGIRGCVRLITQEQAAPLPASQKLDVLKVILDSPLDTEEKRLVLSGLASITNLQALDMAASMLDDAGVKIEAADATVQIARAISANHPKEAGAALKRVLAQPANPSVRKSAQAALKRIKSVD
jgi:HEAT repeat protein